MKIEDIKKDILNKSKKAVFYTEADIYDTMNAIVRDFYGEYTPVEYIRTGQLSGSLMQKNMGLSASVYFDPSVLNYSNPALGQSGVWHEANLSGGEVLNMAMQGSHGGYIQGTPIWSSGMAQLGDIKGLLIKNLKATGL